MTSQITGPGSPARYAGLRICGCILAVMLVFGVPLPASAAAISTQPGLLEVLGEPVGAIDSQASPELTLVGRGGRKARRGYRGGGRKAHRGRSYRGRSYGKRRHYRSRSYSKRHHRGRKHRRRYHRGPSIYLSLPFYGYAAPYYYSRSYSYRPYAGRCAYWQRRCSANWGYGNADYYGCLRYHGCR